MNTKNSIISFPLLKTSLFPLEIHALHGGQLVIILHLEDGYGNRNRRKNMKPRSDMFRPELKNCSLAQFPR